MPYPEPEQAGQALELPAFGTIEPDRVLAQDDLFAVVRDKYPVAPGHTLIIPRRPVERFRELTATEKARLVEPEDLGKAARKRAEYFAADIRIAHDWFSNLTALLDACGRGWS